MDGTLACVTLSLADRQVRTLNEMLGVLDKEKPASLQVLGVNLKALTPTHGSFQRSSNSCAHMLPNLYIPIFLTFPTPCDCGSSQSHGSRLGPGLESGWGSGAHGMVWDGDHENVRILKYK